MSAFNRVLGGTGGMSPTTLDLKARAEQQLLDLLHAENITPRAVYRPGEVCRLLRVSSTTLRQLCELANYPDAVQPHPRALDSFRIGTHHRIAHHALVDWLARNHSFQREG